MRAAELETHIREDHKIPIVRHLLSIRPNKQSKLKANWHANVEILYCIGGNADILYDYQVLQMQKGDVIVINSNVLHNVMVSSFCDFYVFIVDNDFFYDNGIDMENVFFNMQIRDASIVQAVELVNNAVDNSEKGLTTPEIRFAVLGLLIQLCKHHSKQLLIDSSQYGKSNPFRNVISYIKTHFTEKITLDQIARENNISKSFLVHEFKRLTGQTVFQYINTLRCVHAQLLIRNGTSISSAALSSGFENLSYFTRTYKKYMEILPSDEEKQ